MLVIVWGLQLYYLQFIIRWLNNCTIWSILSLAEEGVRWDEIGFEFWKYFDK